MTAKNHIKLHVELIDNEQDLFTSIKADCEKPMKLFDLDDLKETTGKKWKNFQAQANGEPIIIAKAVSYKQKGWRYSLANIFNEKPVKQPTFEQTPSTTVYNVFPAEKSQADYQARLVLIRCMSDNLKPAQLAANYAQAAYYDLAATAEDKNEVPSFLNVCIHNFKQEFSNSIYMKCGAGAVETVKRETTDALKKVPPKLKAFSV